MMERKIKRPELAQRMLDQLKRQGKYYEDYPLEEHPGQHGMERIIIHYVELLEKELLNLRMKLKKTV